jgi:hypothetical protein
MIKPTITTRVTAILAVLGSMVQDPDCASAADWKVPDRAPLLTPWASEVSPANALPEYPRPTLVRAAWRNLNGLWEYAVTDKNRTTAPSQFDGQILVPFCIESALSGVMLPLKPDQRLWYRRNFAVPKQWQGQRILLHFGAVDWQTTVYLNGRELGSHRGGYDPFTFDITGTLKSGESWTTADIWLRKEFTLTAKPDAPLLRILHDEGVEVYLNGVLACRDGDFLTAYDDFQITAEAAATLHPGKNVMAVHCHPTMGGQYIDVGLLELRPEATSPPR